nr:MAG TPA_asm: AcrIIC3 protein [Caudoviricetes sp.]
MSKHTPHAHSRAWKNKVARERRRLHKHPEEAICWICGGPIDMNLPYLHAQAFTLDHLIPLSQGGDINGETKPAHRNCNSKRGNGKHKKRGTNPQTILQW